MIGNPVKAVPRYARLFSDGVGGKTPHIPHVGMGGKTDAITYSTGQFARANPLIAAASIPLGISLNNMAGNPIGGVIDAGTFGLTNFKENEWEQPQLSNDDLLRAQAIAQQQVPQMQQQVRMEVPPQMMGSGQAVTPSIPTLDEEQLRRQRQFLERKIATDMITRQAIEEEIARQG